MSAIHSDNRAYCSVSVFYNFGPKSPFLRCFFLMAAYGPESDDLAQALEATVTPALSSGEICVVPSVSNEPPLEVPVLITIVNYRTQELSSLRPNHLLKQIPYISQRPIELL